MQKTVSPARCIVATLAALAGLALIAAPIQAAHGEKPPTTVTVDNSASNPVPTSVVNPATMPALNSSIDDPGRIPYQNRLVLDCTGTRCTTGGLLVAVGKRLVVQHAVISASFSLNAPAKTAFVTVFAAAGGILSAFPVPVVFGGTNAVVDQPVQFYVDGGSGFA